MTNVNDKPPATPSEAGAGEPLAASGLLADLKDHISRSKVIIRQIKLPRYPAGGTVGIAAASQIMRHMAEAEDELMGLRAQLYDHALRVAANTSMTCRRPEGGG